MWSFRRICFKDVPGAGCPAGQASEKTAYISEKNNCDRKNNQNLSSNGDEKDALKARKRILWNKGKGCESSPAGTCTGCNPSRVSNTPVGSITRLTRCFRSDTIYQCESYCAMDIHTQAEHIASQRVFSNASKCSCNGGSYPLAHAHQETSRKIAYFLIYKKYKNIAKKTRHGRERRDGIAIERPA